jgi:molecular chaperone HscA
MALIQITEPGVAIDPHQRKRGAGVDLGTTHSLIAVVRGGSPVTLPDASDRHLLPSVVRYESEGITVGYAAVEASGKVTGEPPRTTAMSECVVPRSTPAPRFLWCGSIATPGSVICINAISVT